MAYLFPTIKIPQPIPTLKRGNSNPRVRVRVRVCSRSLKESGWGKLIRVSDGMSGLGISLLLSEPVLLGGPTASQIEKGEGGDDKQEYYVNIGYAIRTLREEFPNIFTKEPSFDIYRDDIVFKDPFNTFTGTDNYRRIFWALRFIGNIFFNALWVDIVRVWQPEKNVVMIRWIVHGTPRGPWETPARFDGISEYKLDKKGKIYEHRVGNVTPKSRSKFWVLYVDELIQSLGCPSTANPTYFETSLSSVISSMRARLHEYGYGYDTSGGVSCDKVIKYEYGHGYVSDRSSTPQEECLCFLACQFCWESHRLSR